MGLTDELNIYRQMYALLGLILDIRDDFPKAYKYAFGDRLFMTALDCCELIQAANSDVRNRVARLNEFAVKFGSLQLMLRLCRDRKIVSISRFAEILQLTGNIGRQATGWRKHTLSKEPESDTVTMERREQ